MYKFSLSMVLLFLTAQGMHIQYTYTPSIITDLCYAPHKELTKEHLISLAQDCYHKINQQRKERYHNNTLHESDVHLIDRKPIWDIDRTTSIYGDHISIMPGTKLDRLNIFHTICYLICARDQQIKEHYGYIPCLCDNNKNDYGDICTQYRDTMKRDIQLNGLREVDAHTAARKFNPCPEYTHALLDDMSQTEHGKEYVLSQSPQINCGVTFAHLALRYNTIHVPKIKKRAYMGELKALLPKKHSTFRKYSVGLIINTNATKIFPDEERSPCYTEKSRSSTPKKMITYDDNYKFF